MSLFTTHQWYLERKTHAPTNAVAGYATGRYIGEAPVYQWVDQQGRDLGTSHGTPLNPNNERTVPGGYVAPGDTILSPRDALILKVLLDNQGAWPANASRPTITFSIWREGQVQNIDDPRIDVLRALPDA